MKTSRTGRTWRAGVFLGLVITGILVSAGRIVATAIQQSQTHDAAGLQLTTILTMVLVIFLLVFFLGLTLAFLPSSRCRTAVAEANPDSIVVNGRWNPEFREFLRTRMTLICEPSKLKGIAFTLSADAVGISIWIGGRKPDKAVAIVWSEIAQVTTGSQVASPTRTVTSLRLKVIPDDVNAQFALSSDGWLGMFPRGEDGVATVASELESLQNHSESNPVATNERP